MKRILALLFALVLALSIATIAYADKPGGFDNNGNATSLVSDNGFNQFGYNYNARIFSGPASGWCLARGAAADCLGIYSNDRLVMKWSQAWADAKFGPDGIAENGDELPWTTAAWVSNEWNGMVPNGSGEVEHVKIVWVGPCTEGATFSDGGSCIWGQFEVIFDHYVGGDFTKAIPAGYGAYK